MRPESVRKFDMFFLASIAMGLASGLLNFETQVAALSQAWADAGWQDQAQTFIVGSAVAGLAVNLLLWWLASRMKQGWVRWVLALFLAISILSSLPAFGSGMASISITGLIALLLRAIGIFFLFQPDAKEWYSEATE